MKLDHDFAHPRRRYSLQGALLLAGGLFAAGFGVQQYFTAEREVTVLEREVAMLASATRGGAGPGVDLDRLRTRIVLANQVVRKKTVPWDGLFRDIENASDSKIGLLAVQPDAALGSVRISGEARDTAALTDYITRLAAQPSLQNVHLAEHEVKVVQGRSIVRFNLNATWKGAQS